MKRSNRIFSAALAALLALSAAGGCAGGQTGSSPASTNSEAGSTAASEVQTEGISFPLKTPVTLTIWKMPINELASLYPDQGKLPMWQELSKRTGIQFVIKTPPVGQEKDQFNLMVASGTLPDIIDGSGVRNFYPGGQSKAYGDGIIIKLNDLQEKYAPDLMKIYKKYPGVDAYAKDDAGNYLGIPFIRGQIELCTYNGMIIRQDWLDDLGLQMPETIDDWHTVLTAFKQKKGATAPLLDVFCQQFMGAYGISNGYFMEDGKVKYGWSDPRYKDFLTEMAKWYKEGLIDPEIATNNSKTRDAKACSEKTGAFNGNAGGGIGKYMKQMETTKPKYKLAGAPNPVLKKGEGNRFYLTEPTVSSSVCCSITPKCKNPDVAMAFLNYGFTDDGYLLYNFGIEGTSYNWVDGYPKYTDAITKDPKGLSMAATIQLYARSANQGPFVQDPRYLEQYQALPEQNEAIKTWSSHSEKDEGANLAYLRGVLNQDESNAVASIDTQIVTYVSEMQYKFMEGQQALTDSAFDAYVSQLKTLGLEKAISVRQGAEDRFKKANPDLYSGKEINAWEMYKDIKK